MPKSWHPGRARYALRMNPSPKAVVICSVLERDAESTADRVAGAPAGCALVGIRADHLRAAEVDGLEALLPEARASR